MGKRANNAREKEKEIERLWEERGRVVKRNCLFVYTVHEYQEGKQWLPFESPYKERRWRTAESGFFVRNFLPPSPGLSSHITPSPKMVLCV